MANDDTEIIQALEEYVFNAYHPFSPNMVTHVLVLCMCILCNVFCVCMCILCNTLNMIPYCTCTAPNQKAAHSLHVL